jgi:hypothetical protein
VPGSSHPPRLVPHGYTRCHPCTDPGRPPGMSHSGGHPGFQVHRVGGPPTHPLHAPKGCIHLHTSRGAGEPLEVCRWRARRVPSQHLCCCCQSCTRLPPAPALLPISAARQGMVRYRTPPTSRASLGESEVHHPHTLMRVATTGLQTPGALAVLLQRTGSLPPPDHDLACSAPQQPRTSRADPSQV